MDDNYPNLHKGNLNASSNIFSGILFVSCVDPNTSHPSGHLAANYADRGADVAILFKNSRKIGEIFRDAGKLHCMLVTGQYEYGVLNLNGPIAQLAATFIFFMHRVPTALWIMDSYPGCLRYITRFWWIFWVPFFLASLLVKMSVKEIYVIDEDFVNHSPSSAGIKKRITYVPLPFNGEQLGDFFNRRRGGKTIGILGNIERDWMTNDFPAFLKQASKRNYDVVIATSRSINLPESVFSSLTVISPWHKEDTNQVFNSCDFLLVPVSKARLIYSSPSKIIDAYTRGLQPIIMTDVRTWQKNKHRRIYRMCLHLDEFFLGANKNQPSDLQGFAKKWSEAWATVETLTLNHLESAKQFKITGTNRE